MRRLFDATKFKADPKPEKVIKGKKPMEAKKKPSGEAVLFKAVWETRKHKSFITGEDLGQDGYPWHFAHVLPKKGYPEFRLLDRNIVLLTQEQHSKWDQGLRSELMLRPEWKKMFELEEKLKEEYKSYEE